MPLGLRAGLLIWFAYNALMNGLLLFAVLALQASPHAPDQITAMLRAKDQMLLDAIAPGDRKAWDAVLSGDAVVVDENGTVMDRAEYLKQLEPLPPGASGSIHISFFAAHLSGDVATVVHTDDEEENYHGQALSARYLTTETWQREAGEWQLRLMHVYAVLKDPPVISLSREAMQQYVGSYQGGRDLAYTIQWDGDHLVGGRQGGSMSRLEVEARDVLFIAGQPRIRKIFQRDERGNITGFVDRRESWDLVWRRSQTP